MDNRRNKTLLRPGLKKNKSSGSSQDNYAGYYQGYIPSAAHAKGGVTKNRHPRGGAPVSAQQVHEATAADTPAKTRIKLGVLDDVRGPIRDVITLIFRLKSKIYGLRVSQLRE